MAASRKRRRLLETDDEGDEDEIEDEGEGQVDCEADERDLLGTASAADDEATSHGGTMGGADERALHMQV